MINRIIRASLENRALVLLLTLMLSAIGAYSVLRTPVDALPDPGRIDREIRLQPRVEHRHEHARQCGDDDRHHHALQVDRVAHVRACGRH